MSDINLIKKARKIRKALGGGMRQSGILAAAGIYAFDNMIVRLAYGFFIAEALPLALALNLFKTTDFPT